MVRRATAASAIAVLALAPPSVASAQSGGAAPPPRTSSLSWVRMPGADECIATQPLARAVEERLGRPVFVSAAEGDVSVEGRVEGAPKAWRATITLRDSKGALLGARELTSSEPSCDSLREPLALVIAVMIDPDASARPRQPPSRTAAGDAAPGAPPVVAVKKEQVLVPVPVVAPRAPAWRFDASVGMVAGAGLVPSPYAGLYAGFILSPPFLSFGRPLHVGFEGYGTALLDSETDGPPGTKASFSTLIVGSGLCPLQLFERWGSFSMCGGGQVGALRARGLGFSSDRNDLYLLLNLVGGMRASIFVLRPIVVRATVDGVLPVLRDRFSYEAADGTSQEIFRPSPVAIAATLGVGVQF